MKKKLLTALMTFTLLMSTACGSVSASEENDVSQENVESTEMESTSDESIDAVIGKSITINTENGSFSVTAKGAHEVAWDYENDTMKIVTIQAEVENIDFSHYYDGEISNYEICDNGVALLDNEEFELEFYDISGGDDGKYEVGAHTSISSKKRVSLPFVVPAECDTVLIKVNGEISNPISLSETAEGDITSESEDIEISTETKSVRSETESTTQIHVCEAEGCHKSGTKSIIGFSGNLEYYCTDHYTEMENIFNNMVEDVNSSTNAFTNKTGTPTTKCAHAGCNNYIASSGDTYYCTTHSRKCLECGKYIDEDAMYCMDCLTKAFEEVYAK